MWSDASSAVGGIVRQEAPAVRLDPERALEPSGLGDELMLAAALGSLEPGVEIGNLSLGCQTMDNVPSLPVVRALQRLCRDVVVVAAADNSGSQRPHWPAALTGVIGVAALRQALMGQLVPVGPGEVVVWSHDGPQTRLEVDDVGMFSLSPAPDGTFRVEARAQGRTIMTEWVSPEPPRRSP